MASGTAPNRQRNLLLNALSTADLALLQPHLQPTPLKLRQHLQVANRQIKTVYFPETGIASRKPALRPWSRPVAASAARRRLPW